MLAAQCHIYMRLRQDTHTHTPLFVLHNLARCFFFSTIYFYVSPQTCCILLFLSDFFFNPFTMFFLVVGFLLLFPLFLSMKSNWVSSLRSNLGRRRANVDPNCNRPMAPGWTRAVHHFCGFTPTPHSVPPAARDCRRVRHADTDAHTGGGGGFLVLKNTQTCSLAEVYLTRLPLGCTTNNAFQNGLNANKV